MAGTFLALAVDKGGPPLVDPAFGAIGDRTYKLGSGTTSEYGRYVKYPGGARDGSLEGLTVKTLSTDSLLIVCNPRTPLCRKKRVRLSDLREARWALMRQPRSMADAFLEIATARGLRSPRISVRTDSLDVFKALVLRGSFLTALPRGAVQSEIAEKRAAVLQTVERLPSVSAALIQRQEALPRGLELLVGEIESSIDQS